MRIAHTSPLALLVALSMGGVACSSADDSPESASKEEKGPENNVPEMPSNKSPENPMTADNECGIQSGFPGDELCIPAPDPSVGLQLHVGPVDYDDPDEVEPYLLEPGGEDVVCFNDRAEDGGFFFSEQHNRMRSGSHHMLIGLHDAEGREEGPTSACEAFGSLGTLPGSQTPRADYGMHDVAPEDKGLARQFPEGAMATFQLHYVNTTEHPVMREAWINLIKRDASEVTGQLNTVFLVGDLGINIAPQTREVTPLTFTPALEEATRISSLNGHSHAHNERFTVWKNRGTAKEELLYESYNWEEPMVVKYNTVDQNPLPDPQALTDGGASGTLLVEPGDTLDWECEVNNTLDTNIRFANEAYTAEMCLLAGAYVSDQAGLFSGGCVSGSCFGFAGGSRPSGF